MKIYIDVSVLIMVSFVTGIQRVTREIILRLMKRSECQVVLMYYQETDDTYYRINNQKFYEYYACHIGNKGAMVTRSKILLSEIAGDAIFFEIDAGWMSKVKRSYLLPILKKQGAHIIIFVHDIIPIRYPQYCQSHVVYRFMDYMGAHLQYADHMIMAAVATKHELQKLAIELGLVLPSCDIVPLGADFAVHGEKDVQGGKTAVLEKAVSCPYLLMVGTIEPRKNHKLLLQAYEQGLREMGYHIILAGSMGWNMEEFGEKVGAHPDYNTRIFILQGLSDKEIAYLYMHARFLVFCSYMEGYGLPLIEAIQWGTPVIAADMEVSREVAGNYADYFTQDDPEQLIQLVSYYDTHSEEYLQWKHRLKEATFIDWDRSAEMMWESIDRKYHTILTEV